MFAIIEDLVKWKNSANEEVLERARAEIRASCNTQRLGLPAYAPHLNPVAVMIGKAMIEIPPKFKYMEPIPPGPDVRTHHRNAEGLAEDVKFYSEWMRKKHSIASGALSILKWTSSEYGIAVER